ncbi:hypothetical protein PWT90_10394 [Aphanocladium album]|nr:hypothetical protein PWT90_10394 [Aphanocladium album]
MRWKLAESRSELAVYWWRLALVDPPETARPAMLSTAQHCSALLSTNPARSIHPSTPPLLAPLGSSRWLSLLAHAVAAVPCRPCQALPIPCPARASLTLAFRSKGLALPVFGALFSSSRYFLAAFFSLPPRPHKVKSLLLLYPGGIPLLFVSHCATARTTPLRWPDLTDRSREPDLHPPAPTAQKLHRQILAIDFRQLHGFVIHPRR